jgi:hypothetical protein
MEKTNFFLMIAAVAATGGAIMLALRTKLRSVLDAETRPTE